jgi:hypothetical protein
MSYYIYKIAYRISDEIKAKKDAEKPFWWEHLHPEVKEKPIEEIDKLLLEGGITQEALTEMTKHEKYMAISEGCYVIDSQKAAQELAELDSLKKEVERSKTNFLNQPMNNYGQQNVELQPIQFGKVGDSSHIISSVLPPIDPMAAKISGDLGGNVESPFSASPVAPVNKPMNDSMDFDDEHVKIMADNINDDDIFGGGDGGGMSKSTSPDVRKYAQSIVRQTVQQINNKADEIPDSVAVMKEQELLQAVINELQTLK